MAVRPESALTSRPLAEWLSLAARERPDHTALECGASQLSYRALSEAVDELARTLAAADIGPGDRVGIAATRSVATIVSILAVVQVGAGYMPLDLAYPVDRLQAMLGDSAPRMVLGDPAALSALAALIPEAATLFRAVPRAAAVFGAEPDLTYVLFTSGSTGRPKGVAMGAAPLRNLIAWHAAHPRLGLAARTLQFAPLSFDVHFQEIFSTLACGGTLVVLPDDVRRDPQRLRDALVEHRVERIFLPYVALQMIAEAGRDASGLVLRDVVSAGEQLQVTPAIRALFRGLPGAELHNHYGPTESHVVTAHELRGDAELWPAIPPIGKALPHVGLALRHPETHLPEAGDSGELLLGGPTLAHGYLGQPGLTGERFLDAVAGLEGRWYATGDIVQRDREGSYTYLGRADQQMKVDGFRIEPGEIELALMAHDDIKDAVVTAPVIVGAGPQLVAYLVARDPSVEKGSLVTRLREHLRGRLPEYMVPVRYELLERLPTTPSGKIDRRALPIPTIQALPRSGDAATMVRALWQELLGLDHIAEDQNLFDLGARSLLVLRFIARFKELDCGSLGVADVYDRPTLAGLAATLRGPGTVRRVLPSATAATAGIAIVGMAARTPGGADVEAFWSNLLAGREGIRHFRADELDPSIPESVRSRPNFVAARGVLEDAGRFDAAFFGISAREATLLDPQQRLMLEICWTALEHAGIDPSRAADRIGVYAGSANNTYITGLRQEQPELVLQAGEFATMLASEKDYVATRVANRLNLHGPAVSVHTACSTGLVAVAQAWHALASGQCDVALAGGSTVVVPQEGGYLHVEGAMEAADGHCRPFDAGATGTVFASGAGVVVLKRLEDALAQGDVVYAVIRGVGLNNDGGDKASFTAPSVTGQAGAIRMALDHARVDARSIGFVEAHGTGTALGDPIEVAALTRAWREDTPDSGFCGLGSLKGNLGHMVAAAGVVGLIKTALALHREVIPATLHYQSPNPQIDFASSPFKVVAANTPWPRGEQPRRAAVSSFGVGGTNAHAVLEEGPAEPVRPPALPGQRRLVLPLSGRTAADVLRRAQDLAAYLESNPGVPLDRVAATLMHGRKPMAQRACVVARDAVQAAAALRGVRSAVAALARPRVVFVFPGQGSQHPGMARGLYDESPAFRVALDQCLEVALGLGIDLRSALIDAAPDDAAAAEHLAQTRHAQPALFAMSHALAALLDSLGVRPAAMIGHSIGEYAAASLAGVMTMPEAMAAVIERGQAMFAQPPGAMLAVRADLAATTARLPAGIDVAGINAPALTVVAGDFDAIDALARSLEAAEIGTTRLKVSHAFHSASMDGALPRIEAALRRVALKAPAATVYSCVSGAPLGPTEATDPAYWARQVREPVQFHRAVASELAHADTVFVEVGPGQALTALLRQFRTASGASARVIPLLGTPREPGEPAANLLAGIGQLWGAGVDVLWPVPSTTRRLALPTYPFGGEHHWFRRRAVVAEPAPFDAVAPVAASPDPIQSSPELPVIMSRLPRLHAELKRILSDVSGIAPEELTTDASFVDQGLDSLSMTQATLELERVFGLKVRFRRLQEDLGSIDLLAAHLDAALPADRFAPPAAPVPTPALAPSLAIAVPSAAPAAALVGGVSVAAMAPAVGATALQQLIQQQMQLMSQQLSLLAGQGMPTPQPALAAAAPPAAQTVAPAVPAPAGVSGAVAEWAEPSKRSLVEKPFGASPRLTLEAKTDFTPEQRRWLDDFIARYNARSGKSKAFSQANRQVMADPRVVTGFNPLWKDLVYPIVADRSDGANVWDLDGNEYIDLLSCFGGNLLGYQPPDVIAAMARQLQLGLEVGPQHPLAADVARLISEFTGMQRVGFCNTGSEAVMGAMRIARTVTGRKTIAIFTNSYHGIFDEVIVRGTKQLRSLSAAPGILANAVENILVLDWNSEDSLKVLRERGAELAAIMTEPIQNKYPTVQPREFVKALRDIADQAGCALIFDEVVTGFRVAPGGAQEFYGVRADIATYGKVIGGGLPFAAIAGNAGWLDALDGGHWQYGDDSFPEAGVTYFAGTFVRHPLALAAAHATLLHIQRGGREFYRQLNDRTQRLIDRLNTAFAVRGAPVKAVHCASIWRLQWDDNQRYVSLFYYLVRFHGLHLYEQFGHFVTEAMTDAHTDRIFQVFTDALDELMALGFIAARDGTPPPSGDRKMRTLPNEAPLTPGQTERWLAASFDPQARRALNESLCLSLQGQVDLTAMEAALGDVLARHEAFRICFDAAEPLQRLDAAARPQVQHVDLRAQADAEAALDRFCEQASVHDFALDTAPLAKVSLLRLADGRTVVHLVTSHLIFDGWASPVFLADLATAYQARCAGMAPRWPAEAESPRAFGIDEQARWDGPQGQEALAFWKSRLNRPPQPLVLGDRQPPQPRRYSGDTLRAQIDGELLATLQKVARQHKATMFQLLLAAVSVAVQRRTGSEDFVISIPYASQSLGRHGPLIGDGVLDLPLRLACRAADAFPTVLGHVRNALMDALEQPLATQGSVARAVGVASVGNRPPLTGVFFNLNPKLDLRGFEPLQAQVREARKLGLLGEVIFNFYETPEALTLDLHHSTEFFSPERASELVGSLLTVLRQIAGDHPAAVPAATLLASPVPAPTAPLASPAVPALSAHDLERLTRWNATEVAYENGLRLGDLIDRMVQAHPDAVAIRFEGQSVTYAEMDRMAWALAHQLRALGVVPGDLIGVCLDRSVELVVALVAVTYSGAAYVPLDPAYPIERISHMCEDARMPVLVTRHAELGRVGAAIPPSIHSVMVDDLASQAVLSVERGALSGTSDDPAYVIFTSGSTGRPKGAMNAHKAIVNRLQWMQQEYELGPRDRVMQKTPYSFDVSVWEFFWPLMTGATIVVARPEGHRDAAYLVDLIQRENVTVLHFVPSMLRLFLDEPGAVQCRSVRQVVCSGEALPIDAVDRFFEVMAHSRLGNLYGPTEAAVDVTCWNCQPGDPRRMVPIGRPIANTQMYVLGDALELLPPGAEGELYIGGVQVGMGYVSRPDLTSERFLPDPFVPGGRMYKTGDIGRWLADGAIEYLGRADHQVKIRGFRIELGEIESQLMHCQGVNRCVVVARDLGDGDMRLVAYVVPRGMMPAASELRVQLSRSLPEFMVPQVYVAMGDIPLLPNGKIDRKALPSPALAAVTELPLAAPAAAAAGPAEAIAQAMAAVLKRPVGLDDNFFDLGGHSLLAARLSARLGEAMAWRPGISAVFSAPTPRALAALLPGQPVSAPADRTSRIPRRADQATGPLSLMQERVWFMETLHPGKVVYHIEGSFRLVGLLDETAFDSAVQALLVRQAALRTVLEESADGVVQRVLPALTLPVFPAEDLSSLPSPQREARLLDRLAELSGHPFGLLGKPLFKLHMFRLAEDEHALFLLVHHIQFDGRSMTILVSELAELYRAHQARTAPRLPDLPTSYLDFAAWQRDSAQGEAVLAEVAHWRHKLAGLGEPLALPTDHPRPPQPSNAAGAVELSVSGSQTERLRQLGRSQEASVFMVVLAGYYAVLQRLTGQTDFVVGFPVQGRDDASIEELIGFFANILPLRLTVQPDHSFTEVIANTKTAVLEALQHADAPFEQIVRALQLPRDESRSPVFQTLFAFQDATENVQAWGNLRATALPETADAVSEDLAVWMVARPDGLTARLNYATDLFSAESMARFAQRYVALLDAMADDPARPIGALPLLLDQERRQLETWNQTAAPLDETLTVAELLQTRMHEHANNDALVVGTQTWSMRELQARANQLAHLLRASGIGRGKLVGICLERSAEMLLTQLAVMSAGAAYVPLDPAYPRERLSYMAEDAGLALVVTDATTRHDWAHGPVAALCLADAGPSIDSQSASPFPRDDSLAARPVDPAYVIYTSGSTGKPKGVSVPHGAVVNFLMSMARQPGMAATDRIVAITTISFDIAVLELLLPLTVGGCIVLAGREHITDGANLRRLLEQSGASMMQATPSTWRLLLAAGWSGAPGFKALVGGEALPADLAEQLAGCSGALWNMYGPTETTVWSSCCQISKTGGAISIGKPIANTQVHVLDEQGSECPIGVPGEIYIAGSGVAIGYLHRPELTSERFLPDRFSGSPGQRMYRTGDRGRWTSAGELEHLGRLDAQVKIRGHRIELGEIESTLSVHVGVAGCVVVVREDRPGDVRLAAYFVPKGAATDVADLRSHLRARLPDYMVPQHLVPLPSLPLLPNGKIDRKALPVPSIDAPPAKSTSTQPSTPDEVVIAGIWSEVLGVKTIHAKDNFFDLGGHSLLAMRALSEMSKKLKRPFEMRQLVFESLASMAKPDTGAGARASSDKPQAPQSRLRKAVSFVAAKIGVQI